MTYTVLPGCEPFSHAAGASLGALVLHGFTGTPVSMRPIADGLAAAGFDVELPRLPGHATHVDDMLATRWDDWLDTVEATYQALAERVAQVVVIGQSMGATLALATALTHPDVSGVVAVNPLTTDRGPEALEMIDDLLDDGFALAPAGPSDIADPGAHDPSYADTPLAPLRSLLVDGVAPIQHRYGEGAMPLRLFTSRNDHVVAPTDSEWLAGAWGGPVENTWLERGYHVATLDYDREIIESGTLAFVVGLAQRTAAS